MRNREVEPEELTDFIFKCHGCTPRRIFTVTIIPSDKNHVQCHLKGCKGPLEDITKTYTEGSKKRP
jgi:hypothetical protein